MLTDWLIRVSLSLSYVYVPPIVKVIPLGSEPSSVNLFPLNVMVSLAVSEAIHLPSSLGPPHPPRKSAPAIPEISATRSINKESTFTPPSQASPASLIAAGTPRPLFPLNDPARFVQAID